MSVSIHPSSQSKNLGFNLHIYLPGPHRSYRATPPPFPSHPPPPHLQSHGHPCYSHRHRRQSKLNTILSPRRRLQCNTCCKLIFPLLAKSHSHYGLFRLLRDSAPVALLLLADTQFHGPSHFSRKCYWSDIPHPHISACIYSMFSARTTRSSSSPEDQRERLVGGGRHGRGLGLGGKRQRL